MLARQAQGQRATNGDGVAAALEEEKEEKEEKCHLIQVVAQHICGSLGQWTWAFQTNTLSVEWGEGIMKKKKTKISLFVVSSSSAWNMDFVAADRGNNYIGNFHHLLVTSRGKQECVFRSFSLCSLFWWSEGKTQPVFLLGQTGNTFSILQIKIATDIPIVRHHVCSL